MKKIRKSHRHQIMRHRGLSPVSTYRPSSVMIDCAPGADKQIIIIETPPTAAKFIQVTALMSDAEIEQAKKERPDLIFRIPDHMVVEHALQDELQGKEPEGESLTTMTIPAKDQERWLKDLGLKG